MNKKIASFTGLRFVMIMTIVISHLEFLKEIVPVNAYYPKYWSYQVLGVNFFFLLSGFGMMLGNIRRTAAENIRLPTIRESINYGINHVRKIYPLYLVTLVVGLVASITLGIFYYEKPLATICCNELVKLAFTLPLLQETTGIEAISHAYNGVAWFLSCLFCIYLVSPLIMYYIRKYSKSTTSDLICIAVELAFIIGLAYLFGKVQDFVMQSVYADKVKKMTLVYGSPYRRVFYVMVGMSLAMIYNRVVNAGFALKEKTANILEIAIVIIAVVYYFFRKSMPTGLYHYAIDIVICAGFIIIFAFDKGNLSKFFAQEKLQRLGNMAMYIFLIHYPIRIWGGKIAEHYIGWNLTTAMIFIVLEFVSTYILSDWVYRKSLQKE